MSAEDSSTPAFVAIGRVARAHGLQGEVSFVSESKTGLAPPAGIEVWFVPPPDSVRSARVESVRQGPKGPLIRFVGIDDVDAAATLRGLSVLARREDLPVDFEDDLRPDPVGLELVDEERGSLGRVEDIIVTGANDVWVVNGPFGEVLVPVIDEVVVSIDEVRRTARVRLLPGLVEDEGGG